LVAGFGDHEISTTRSWAMVIRRGAMIERAVFPAQRNNTLNGY